MKEELIKVLVSNLEVIISAGTTLFLAWIKKRYDLRKLKDENRLTAKGWVIEKRKLG